MTGTLLNIATILIGSILGIGLGSRFPDRVRQTAIAGLGLFTLAMGLQMFLTTKNSLIVLGSVVLGALLGELLKIEDRLQRLGQYLENRFAGGSAGSSPEGSPEGSPAAGSRFVRGFLTTTVLFCVGPMAILGPIQNGLSGNFQILAVKSILDGLVALAFASSLGVGVIFSALAVLIYQGGISLLAAQLSPLINADMLGEMNATGGVIIAGIAISGMLELRKIRIGSFLPALVIAPLLVAILAAFGK